tara:strand:+ start:1261 stop:1506 length:246 start_codon:yes stop_codon:yes gene_type:complete
MYILKSSLPYTVEGIAAAIFCNSDMIEVAVYAPAAAFATTLPFTAKAPVVAVKNPSNSPLVASAPLHTEDSTASAIMLCEV